MKLAPFDDLEDATEGEREESGHGASEHFDRMAFTMAALRLVRPAKMTVAVCESASRLRVLAGREWGEEGGQQWALVAIPKNASRRSIALALAGLGGDSSPPYMLDVLLRAESSRS
jgi:hypothetical protein